MAGIVTFSRPAGAGTPGNPAQLATGERVYVEACAACHGPQGEGQRGGDVPAGQMPAPPHDQTGHTWHHPDEQLFQITKYGGMMGMPAFGDSLTDDEIEAVLAYIKTMWTEEQRALQAERSGS